MELSKYDYLFKIMLLGSDNVGKSSIISWFMQALFQEKYQPTIGIEFNFKIINFDGKVVKVHVWDRAGIEKYVIWNISKHFIWLPNIWQHILKIT